MTDTRRFDAAADAVEHALATKSWALHAAASTVGIERKMTSPEVVAYWLAAKALEAADGVPDSFSFKCHLCGKVKEASTEWRALYTLAFHYDRRHNGWTHEERAAAVSLGDGPHTDNEATKETP